MKKTTKFSLFSLFSVALITPVLIVNQISINNSKQRTYQNSSKNLLINDIDKSNLIQLNLSLIHI